MLHSIIAFIGIIVLYFIIKEALIIFKQNKKTQYLSYDRISSKINQLHWMQRLSFYVSHLQLIFPRRWRYASPIVIFIFSLSCGFFTFILSYFLLGILSSAFLFSIFGFSIPYFIIEQCYYHHQKMVLFQFPSYLLSLKNYTQVSNQIVMAMQKVNCEMPLRLYIDKFNISVQKGMPVYDAFEILKQEIHIKSIQYFLSALQHCDMKGGDVTYLLDQYITMLNQSMMQQEKERQNNMSSFMILIVLIMIHILIIVSFIYSNSFYQHLITTTLVGKTIMNISIISYGVMFVYMRKLNKREE